MPDRLPPLTGLDQIADPGARRAVRGLLNLVEEEVAENRALREDVRRLRDEIARLQGEHGRPALTPDQPAPAAGHSPERERRPPATRRTQPELPRPRATRIDVPEVDPAPLPPAAEFKGHEEVVAQDIVLRPDAVLFRKATWCSPAEGRTYPAPQPAGYGGEVGVG
jgi:hypothetical protein